MKKKIANLCLMMALALTMALAGTVAIQVPVCATEDQSMIRTVDAKSSQPKNDKRHEKYNKYAARKNMDAKKQFRAKHFMHHTGHENKNVKEW